MGTNYYARINICKCCNRFDELHIGKSSAGWTFSFHSIPERELVCWQDWYIFLNEPNVKIFNECGEEITSDNFIELVNSKKSARHNHAEEYPEGSYLDPEGNSFSNGEFS